MAKNMLVSSRTICVMDKVCTSLEMRGSTRVAGRRENRVDLDSIRIGIVHADKDCGKMGKECSGLTAYDITNEFFLGETHQIS